MDITLLLTNLFLRLAPCFATCSWKIEGWWS